MTLAPWPQPASPFTAPTLAEAAESDVCVIGAGFSGLSAAYRLACAGASVVVLEAGDLGAGESGRSTAHLSTILSKPYRELEQLHGADGARLIHESHAAAIDFIEQVCRRESIACGFSRLNGFLVAAADQPFSILEDELAACQRAGMGQARIEQAAPLKSWHTGPCLMVAGQGQLEPLGYLAGLARAAVKKGARIFLRSHGRLMPGRPLRVETASGTVSADSVVVATNAPIDDRIAISTRQAAYRTYAIAATLSDPGDRPCLVWDTLQPYHYLRRLRHLLLIGGEDHKVAHAFDPLERWSRLEAWARHRFAGLGSITHRWSGQIQASSDGIAFIGQHPTDAKGIYVITGDCGNGITHGTLGGMIVGDLILGRPNPWAPVYDPSRPPRALAALAVENIDAAAQYLRYAGPGEARSVEAIAPGEGAVVRRGLIPVAVYRDAGGKLHERSAVCPHLGGMVCWNPAEKSWDCPVHGSRFSATGEVLTGPSNDSLAPPLN